MKTAFVFPAFITDYTNKELDFLKDNHINLRDYLNKASVIIGKQLPEFSYESDEYKSNELYSQIIAYLFSCAFIDVFKKKQIQPEYIAGYSMGIYAALYAAGVYSIETGIQLIYKAFKLVSEVSREVKYGMGAIIGLTEDDIQELIFKNDLKLEIININNQHSIVTAGLKNDIILLLEKAKEEGAMSVAELTVNTPYHSKYLIKYSSLFKEYIQSLQISDAKTTIISTYDQKVIHKVSDIQQELVINLTEKINWLKTMQKLIQEDVSIIYEMGAGKDLKKISRFIEGDYKLKSVY